MKSVNSTYKRIWQLSLGSFILAALTGFLYRFGMLFPLPDTLDLANIRHAHSHLMFFNWISPPIMVWMASGLAERTSLSIDHERYKICLYTMLLLGFLAYPFFFFYGYRSMQIGPADLPVAAVISGLVMFTWYWFAWLYFSDRKQAEADLSISIFDGALVALLISSLGAWGVSVFQFVGTHNPLVSSALTHFFLAVFTEGWAVLGILGIIWDQFPDQNREIPFSSGWLWEPILIGSMLIFPFSLTQSLVTPLMLISAKAGLSLIILSLSLHIYLLLPSKYFTGFVWNTIFGLMGIKILFQSIAVLPVDLWPGGHGLRILYLHLLLLGIISISLIYVFQLKRQSLPGQLFTASVLLVIISLFTISGYAPLWLIPPQPYQWVLGIAFLPMIPAGWLLLNTLRKK